MTNSPFFGAGTSEPLRIDTGSLAYPSRRSSIQALLTRSGVPRVSASSSAPEARSRSAMAFATPSRSAARAGRSGSISGIPRAPVSDGEAGNLPDPDFVEAGKLSSEARPAPGRDVLRGRVLDEVVQIGVVGLGEDLLLDRVL